MTKAEMIRFKYGLIPWSKLTKAQKKKRIENKITTLDKMQFNNNMGKYEFSYFFTLAEHRWIIKNNDTLEL